MINRLVMCGAAASVIVKALLSFSRCKPHLLQQIIYGTHRITPASQLSTDDGSAVDPSYYTTPKLARANITHITKDD
ncbi:hypothetical protein BFJ70_g4039 [Fusarium oxysporum]|nr:hypothetical protein NW764_006199 [Fusarium oxysporum]RKL43724.1 hypothetical protein BFJ70_g4039 [Fusarium oxysporum]